MDFLLFAHTEMMQVFAMFDQDRDGYIQASELGNILRLLGIPFSPDSLASMIANADTKGTCHSFFRSVSWTYKISLS